MKLDKNILSAVKKNGDDRIVIHTSGVFSCVKTEDTKFGDKGAFMQNASLIQGVKSVLFLGDVFIPAPFVLVDLKENDRT